MNYLNHIRKSGFKKVKPTSFWVKSKYTPTTTIKMYKEVLLCDYNKMQSEGYGYERVNGYHKKNSKINQYEYKLNEGGRIVIQVLSKHNVFFVMFLSSVDKDAVVIRKDHIKLSEIKNSNIDNLICNVLGQDYSREFILSKL